VEFRILGPLEVLEDGRPLALGRLKERIVLAVLLLHANEFVSRERLIDELWGVAPPPTARKAVNVYISKLRKTLGGNGHDPIATSDGGYRLVVDPEQLDAEQVRGLVASAGEHMAAGETASASRLLREALGLWRGPTLAGFNLESVGRDEVAQLDELRLTVLMDRIDCDLAQGGHERALGELQVLVREHPLRERLRAQLMLALYRADRQADALEAYRQARHALIEELGIEPSESLQRLHQAILRHDPALEAPAGIAGAPVAAAERAVAPAARPPSRRAHVAAALGVGLVVAAGAIALAVEAGGGRTTARAPLAGPRANSLVRLDAATGAFVSDVAAGIEPGSIAVGRSALWVVNRGDRTITRYSLAGRAHRPFGVASAPYDIAADGDGNVWVSDRKPAVTWILHPAAGTGTAAVTLQTKDIAVPGAGAAAEAVGAGYLWVIAGPLDHPAGNDRLSLIGVRSHRLVSSIRLGRQATAIAFGYGSAWVGTYDRGHARAWLSVVGPGSTRPDEVPLETGDGWGPQAIAAGAGSIWVLTSANTVIRIDPETDRVLKRISLAAQQPTLLAVGGGAVWTANLSGPSVTKIDPASNRVVRTIPLGSDTSIPCGLAATGRALWVALGDAYCDSADR
jgi:DNA-binding SARP family transcriptional activator/DNA-binding beta-propeller fold protein YncE